MRVSDSGRLNRRAVARDFDDSMTQSAKTASPSRYWHVRIAPKPGSHDSHARTVLHDIRQSGLAWIEGVRSSRLFLLDGSLDEPSVRLIADQLLVDPVVEIAEVVAALNARPPATAAIEVQLRPGVMDPVALSTTTAIARLLRHRGSPGVSIRDVRTARRYEIIGARDTGDLKRIATRVLANDCVESVFLQGFGHDDALPTTWSEPLQRPFEVRRISLRDMDATALTRLSREAHLFLSMEEMIAIQQRYREEGRDPTDLELETLAQTWSEHCVHKTLKSEIEYEGEDFGKPGTIRVRFGNLLRDTIAATTRDLNRDWCLSVFVDNAGVIALDDDFGIAFKCETHNHPSAIEPYGGAATGVGGCIRDVMGCGLGAKPIASTDVFCVAPPEFDAGRLPRDTLHPRRILQGVIAGVRDYGNRMGIPTVNGAIHFDERFLANPLVFCGCVGLIPRKLIHKKPNAGDRIVVAGGRTGRDGIHGATFSSAELSDGHADEFGHAVQIGNAIEEKRLLDALLLARDHDNGCLYSAITDCGAGGLSSAVGEMGAELGADVELAHVPLKYAGLRYDEIWISEAQERMVFAVPERNLATFLDVFRKEEVEATVIGTFPGDGKLRVRYHGAIVGEMDMRFLHEGLPRTSRKAAWTRKEQPRTPSRDPLTSERLLDVLRSLNVASREWVIRQYDHEVQGRSVIKPLSGPGSGPSDAAVLRPVYDRPTGIALGCGLCPAAPDDDPYWMAVLAVDEALRNVVCVGADPTRTAILDNFCWPKVDSAESLGALVRTCRGASDAARTYELPFISGKDSLNNEFVMSEEESRRTGLPRRLAIPYTLLISAVGIVPDVRACVSSDLKSPDDCIVLASAPVRIVGLNEAKIMHHRVAGLIQSRKVTAAHDVSDGGLAAALAEMCVAGGFGASVSFGDDLYPYSLIEPVSTTYVLTMKQVDAAATGLPVIGRVTGDKRLRMGSSEGRRRGEPAPMVQVDVGIDELAAAWKTPILGEGGR